MNGPIEEQYFNWLCAKVVDRSANIYYGLLQIMHETEFVWIVPGDDNREDEGLLLRQAFMTESGSDPDISWASTGCSVFEMLYAFSKRAEFQTGETAREWFWHFVQNLGLDEYRIVTEEDVEHIEQVLYNFVWRLYDDSGQGSMFPLRWPKIDQRDAEIWLQFCEYVEEQQLA